MPTASEVREPDAYRDCSNRLLDGAVHSADGERRSATSITHIRLRSSRLNPCREGLNRDLPIANHKRIGAQRNLRA